MGFYMSGRILLAEDDSTWQGILKSVLEDLVGSDSVDLAATWVEAKGFLAGGDEYLAYVLDGEEGKRPNAKPFGIPLARQIIEKEGSPDKIRVISGNPEILDEAQGLGITTYTKGTPNNEKGYRDAFKIKADLAEMLGSG